jgi:PKD repeat protein
MVCQGDCDDTNANIFPEAPETCDDGIDSDCSGADDLTPEAAILYAPADPVQVSELISVRVGFSGADTGDTHSAVCYWGDLGFDNVDPINNDTVVEMPHTYNDPGVYTARVTVSDDYCGGGEAIYEYVVVYDPSGGFVTGGGWIWSEAGWCKLNEWCANAEGKANFGFVSRYKKGATVPTGNTEFNFSAGDLDFHSDEYEWLVVTQGDSNAQFKGNGRINGETCLNGNNYRFMVWAGDHDPDTFRIRIWCEDADASEIAVYDNGFDQEIGGGSIVIHTGKNK